MTYNAKYNEQNYKYRSEKFKRVGIDFDKEYYETILKPYAEKMSIPVGTFIKQAVDKEIMRMQSEQETPTKKTSSKKSKD